MAVSARTVSRKGRAMSDAIEEQWQEEVAEMRKRLFPAIRLEKPSLSGLTLSEQRERKKREARLFWDDTFGKGRPKDVDIDQDDDE